MTCIQELPAFDKFCVLSAYGKVISAPSFSTVRIRDDLLHPRYQAGDCVRIDFTTEPLAGEWGAVDHLIGGRAYRSFGVIRRRDRRGVAVAVAGTGRPHFIAAQRIIRLGWARPWDAENLLVSYLKLQAMQARKAA